MHSNAHPARSSAALIAVIALCVLAIARIAQLERAGSPIGRPTLTSAFSPNGDGLRDQMVLMLDVARRDRITVRVLDARRREVRTLALRRNVRGRLTLRWDGRTSDGERASVGTYRIDVRLQRAGHSIELPQTTRLDLRRPRVWGAQAALDERSDVLTVRASGRGLTNAFVRCDGPELDRLRYLRGRHARSDRATESFVLSVRAPESLRARDRCMLRVRDLAWNEASVRFTVHPHGFRFD